MEQNDAVFFSLHVNITRPDSAFVIYKMHYGVGFYLSHFRHEILRKKLLTEYELHIRQFFEKFQS